MDIESRCIEFIPHDERYGSARRLFTIWFSANLQVTTLIVGTLGVVAGLNLLWTCVALVIGNIVGTIFMAAHSAQGPHLGIPQMIQSRAQFGVLGASLPLLVVVFVYILFTAANGVIMRDAVKMILPVGDDMAIALFGLATLVISYVGYELIHRMGVIMTLLSGGVFLIAAVLVLRLPMPAHALSLGSGFKGGVFLLVVTQAASWTLGFGPYVADYSRYLPHTLSTRRTFWFSYLGNVLGSTLVMLLGALLATMIATISKDPATGISGLFGSWSWVAQFVIVLGVIEVNVLNLYSAYMSSATILTGMRGLSAVGKGFKFAVMGGSALIATLIAIATQYNFEAYFSDILIAQIYFLVPWSSINLVDYYFIRKGVYSVDSMYRVDGEYGAYNHKTLMIYCVAVVACVPFMHLSFYQGYLAELLGADHSWLPALIVPGLLYYMANRSLATRPALPRAALL